MSKSNILACVNNSFTFFKSAVLLVISLHCCLSFDFSLIAIDDVDLRFSLMLVRKAKAVAGKLHESRDYITDVISPYM